MKTSNRHDEFLVIGSRTYARLKGKEDRREYKLGWKPIVFGAGSLAFCLILAFMARAGAEAGDYARVQILGWLLTGFFLLAMFLPLLYVGLKRSKATTLPAALLPIPSPSHLLVAVRPSAFGVGVGAIGWLNLDNGRFQFSSKSYDFDIGSWDWDDIRMIEDYATIRLKRDPSAPGQMVKVFVMKVTNEDASLSRAETERLAAQLKQLPGRVGRSVFPPIEVYPVPFDSYVIFRATVIGLLAGLCLFGLTALFTPRPPPVETVIALVIICGFLGTLFASSEPLMAAATQKTIDRWRRGM